MAEIERRSPTGRRRESKAARREQLMDATLATVAQRGLAATTLADVADRAGLSRGIVNFHFDSKERLLLETLSRLSAEYDANWREELMAARPLPAARLRALVAADLAPRICAPEKVAAWFAFFAEAAARPHFRELCWDRDDAYLAAMTSACEALEREERYGLDPAKTAMSIYAMQEGLWLRLMLGNAEMSRTDALDLSLGLLGTLFPRHFTSEGDLRADR